MNYTWEITGLKRVDSPSVKNIIIQTYWKKIGTDKDGNQGEFSGATPFEPSDVDPENFISYDDLTEEIVLEWIKSKVVGIYEEHVNEQIQRQINEKKNAFVSVSATDLPWSNSSSPKEEQ